MVYGAISDVGIICQNPINFMATFTGFMWFGGMGIPSLAVAYTSSFIVSKGHPRFSYEASWTDDRMKQN